MRSFYVPQDDGVVASVVGIDHKTGPVRILSVVMVITYRHTGNTSGGRPQTAVSGGGDPTERHAPKRQEMPGRTEAV